MIKRALISVYDKEGITELASELIKSGVEIISTGGTYKLLSENGFEITRVEDITGFPEILSGRVKTLHPKIFGGILSDRSNESHNSDSEKLGLAMIDLVIVNLYPFEDTVMKENVTEEEAIEQIDIGGITLIRAAAKNFRHVIVLVSKYQYEEFLRTFRQTGNRIPAEYSRMLAYKAFKTTSAYDLEIRNYFYRNLFSEESDFLDIPDLNSFESAGLRYGENPHQKAILLKDDFDDRYEVLHGKELSFNNLLDTDAAYSLVSDFEDSGPFCGIIKHGNPCGAAVSDDIQDAFAGAFATDTVSPFGGIIIFNKKIDFKTSIDIDKLFTEIILAPDFENEALELLKKKKNRRLIRFRFKKGNTEFRKISGGVLFQEKDSQSTAADKLNFVTVKKADIKTSGDLVFAEKIAKHVKSNAVVFAKNNRTLAIGGGQPSRIDSTRIAVMKAKEFGLDLKGSVCASDAFFPFSDGLLEIAKAGAAAVIQPGGSVRDEEVIKAADENGIAMAFTGVRHFKH
ncbi:MAG: bifunctional phosphoribosylaminoimidazolecarboxamide formyltransferase/IMP cyclohydrolase [Bacteroidetes bacterium]|nr:bifunctional phosphoribosylaminoimidazolecarboxamide formyltransferase/IMP cyclohydrolase [Bacteroidota bacterium]